MDDQLRVTLQSLLRITKGTPQQHRMEELEMSARTHLGLYERENNLIGATLYRNALKQILEAESAEALEIIVAGM
jgi:hypothetical protein